MVLFCQLGLPKKQTLNKNSKTSIHLGSKGNIRDGVGECDKEEYLIKLATTVRDGSLIPLGQLHDTSHHHHIQGRGSWGIYTPTRESHQLRVTPSGLLVLQLFQVATKGDNVALASQGSPYIKKCRVCVPCGGKNKGI